MLIPSPNYEGVRRWMYQHWSDKEHALRKELAEATENAFNLLPPELVRHQMQQLFQAAQQTGQYQNRSYIQGIQGSQGQSYRMGLMPPTLDSDQKRWTKALLKRLGIKV